MSKRDEIIAAGFREMADEMDEQRQLLEDIKRILVTSVDDQSEQRTHVRDEFNRLGGRVLRTENRVAALELVAGGRNGPAE